MSKKLLLNYCQGTLEQGSVLAMEKSTPIVGVMPFKEIKGNAYSFNVVDTLIPTAHRTLGQDVDADELQSTKVTKELMILTNSVKTDRALGIMSDITSVMAEGQNLAMISSGKALEKKVIAELENYLSNGSHRALKKLLKAENELTETIESFGKRVIAYNGVPIHVSHDLGANEILMVRFAEDGVHGITNSGVKVYEKEAGVHHITDTELLYAIVCKTKNSFSKIEFTTTKSK